MDGLTRDEMKEFLDPRNLVINIKLARIIGNIRKSTSFLAQAYYTLLTALRPLVTQIYGIPKATKGLYIHQVHSILNQLRAWQDELPSDMRVIEQSTPRPVASLHLAYNQCIVQTTRPVLLHLFKMQFQLGSSKARESTPQQEVSSITLALAESCINAAQASSRLVESLFLDGSIATFGFWDAHHIFSAAMILIMSAIMKPTAMNSDLLETLLSVLRSLKSNGNIPAVDFCERLSQLQARVSKLRADGRLESHECELSARARRTARSSRRASPADSAVQQRPLDTPTSMHGGAHGDDTGVFHHADIDVLGDPVMGNFLDGNQMQLLDAFLPEGGIPSDFTSDLDEQLLFGSW